MMPTALECDAPPAGPTRASRTALAALIAHALGALAYARLVPHGFPLAHLRFWSNTALPAALIVAALVALAAARRRSRVVSALAAGLVALWFAAALTGALLFPRALGAVGAFVALVATLVGAGSALVARRARSAGARAPSPGAVAAVLVGCALGATTMIAQRAPGAATRPRGGTIAALAPRAEPPPGAITLRGDLTVDPRAALVQTRCGALELRIAPLLTFVSRSPERFWTVFAGEAEREGPARVLSAWDVLNSRARLRYRDDAQSALDVAATGDAGGAAIEALSLVPRAVYTHLNHYARLEIARATRLWLAFSPTGARRVEALPFDYPMGRPARSAHLFADGTFRVLQAREGEKGPYATLARAPMERAAALAITLFDGERAACRLTFDDWAAQADTTASPAAGWGVPVNSVEFGFFGGAPEAYLLLSLAATGTGRGWDSVGHAAGVYRNRMRVEPLD